MLLAYVNNKSSSYHNNDVGRRLCWLLVIDIVGWPKHHC
jgi:hypothetical protein